MDPVFALTILQEKYKEKQKDVHVIFVDLEKKPTTEFPEI